MKYTLYLSVFAILCLQSCKSFENDVDVQLHPYTPQLFVECYLQPGQPYRLLLTRTQSYFDNFNVLPFVQGAKVVVEHNGVYDTLAEAPRLTGQQFPFLPYFDQSLTRFYNYQSTAICPIDYTHDFHLFVTDSAGHTLTGTTHFLPPVLIDSLTWTFNKTDTTKAALFMKFQDNAAENDFYRPVVHGIHDTKDSDRVMDFVVDDSRFLNGKYVIFGTPYKYKVNDTIDAALYHIDKAYYDFLNTINDAVLANGNPFTTPSRITSTVVGGMGVFTFLSEDKRQIIIHR